MDLFYFETLEKKFLKKPTLVNMFSTTLKQDDNGLQASYISLLIAKSGKPHTIGKELILPAMNENYYEFLKATKFSIQLDESTLPDNKALLLAKNLMTDTKRESIYHTLEEYFKEKEIPMCNILSVATDGAPAMVGCHRGFIAYLKKTVPNVLTIHCVIHRQHLVAKNLSECLHKSLHYVISAINKIKNNSLNDRLFGLLCTENDEDFNQLLFHTEVRWLLRGACLDRF
ncbi:Hypothetical protein CINCED_3A015898 [Cinara cedri]|uniref:Uncharacterized protein n=1 Tax=Cinara cedri TaxID=506608 RepID=A0A5E4NKZ8_9HEMI|nr:Hypothetical protein CINCED_3A015898 [Cinara cedri]